MMLVLLRSVNMQLVNQTCKKFYVCHPRLRAVQNIFFTNDAFLVNLNVQFFSILCNNYYNSSLSFK